ncbi:hypothetical protein ASPACDRAFT_127625 [Aspergillus aculeatus ATCC 16872]|uniref:Uncharacterized protein n=1 Tax=Aspergillus aculeatus (strain ATCC 16872 / CBS 172.66 / WB 5094) TaxID=690307 RepID=A0A1L9WG34_ASPA1|nr:uncharacterized protein ASPACDRAFT_127625 [Aspergillus aculeatus ATCC 16872]OJJ95132.1 hypothetical protein ASPACDRAFT_127625 [Aspergillus aculeatus ATCC 16872]
MKIRKYFTHLAVNPPFKPSLETLHPTGPSTPEPPSFSPPTTIPLISLEPEQETLLPALALAATTQAAPRSPPRPPPNLCDNALHPLRQDPDDRHLRQSDPGRRQGVLRLPACHPQLPLLRP